MPTIKKIGVLTGGGDAPGLNAVIRAVVKTAQQRRRQVIGLEDSFDGLIYPDKSRVLDAEGRDRHPPARRNDPGDRQPRRSVCRADHDAERHLRLLAIASWRCSSRWSSTRSSASEATARSAIAYEFYKQGIPLVGVPKTIDNDIYGTTSCFGFDTAVSFATEAIDRLHTTAEAHRRIIVVEVMGRYAGWIALHAGVAGGADVILIPEIPYDFEKVVERLTGGTNGAHASASWSLQKARGRKTASVSLV